jgi:hypothetical protein
MTMGIAMLITLQNKHGLGKSLLTVGPKDWGIFLKMMPFI